MTETLSSNGVIAAFAALGLGAVAASAYIDDRKSRKQRHATQARRSPTPSFKSRDSSVDFERQPPPRQRRRPSSWDPETRRREEDMTSTEAYSGRTSSQYGDRLAVPLTRDPWAGRRSPGAQVYYQTPRAASYQGDAKPGLEYVEVEPNQFQFIGDYGYFRQGWDIPWDDESPSLASTPTKEFVHDTPYPEYIYKKLPDTGENIRLIEIHPGEGNAPIRCSFCEAKNITQLEPGVGRYAAVSYTWGLERAKKYRLLCDNSPTFGPPSDNPGTWVLWITKAADSVLRKFRRPSKRIVLWIDAICLDQDDDSEEKQYQLRYMAQIYQKAYLVLVWLDEEDLKAPKNLDPQECTEGEKCIDFLKKLGEWRVKENARGRVAKVAAVSKIGELLDKIFKVTTSERIAHFFRSIRWFSRRWIIQEITSATKATVYCGRASVEWEDFIASVNTLWQLNCSYYRSFESGALVGLRVLNTIFQFKEENRNTDLSILKALNLFHVTKCVQPQDRILALLPISDDKDDYLIFHPELRYHKQLKERQLKREMSHKLQGLESQVMALELKKLPHKELTYHLFACFNLLKTNSLDILHCAGAFRPRDITVLDLYEPSWVPDWSCEPRFLSFLDAESFNAGGKDPAFHIESGEIFSRQFRYSSGSNYLIARGFVAGIVGNLQSQKTPRQPSLEAVRKFLEDWADIAGYGPLARNSSSPNGGWKQLATTIVANQGLLETYLARFRPPDSFEVNLGEESHVKEIDEWFEFCSLFGAPQYSTRALGSRQRPNTRADSRQYNHQERISIYFNLVHYTIRGRRLFKTQEGYLGIGPEDIEAGDRVCILYGGRTPFVLRKYRRDGLERYLWKLIGDCYVHGMMEFRGEARPEEELDFWIM